MSIWPPVGKIRRKGATSAALVGRWTLLSKGVQNRMIRLRTVSELYFAIY